MQVAVTLVAPQGSPLGRDAIARARAILGGAGEPVWLEPGQACDLAAFHDRGDTAALRHRLGEALAGEAVDWAVQPASGRRKRILLCDMDSTIIGQECIDELADHTGYGAVVADITARAMAGELDFEQSLRERVAFLEGMTVDTLEEVFAERITINPGARTLVATMRANGAHTLLVSGGFTFFTERVARLVGFEAHQANRLMTELGRLTGTVAEPILARDAKRQALVAACERFGVPADATAAIGDGANDVDLIEAAGLGIAYRAKPVLAARADARIQHGDLTAALHFQGYTRDRFRNE